MRTGPGDLPLGPAHAPVHPAPRSTPRPRIAPDPTRWPFTVFTAAGSACPSARELSGNIGWSRTRCRDTGCAFAKVSAPLGAIWKVRRCRLRDGFGLTDCGSM